MPKQRLTDTGIAKLRAPEKGRIEYFDTLLPGFALRITANGHKSWVVFYRVGRRLRRYTIGTYPKIGLSDARKRARAALEQADKGDDPAADKVASKRLHGDSVKAIADEFIERYAKKNQVRSWPETKSILDLHVLPEWGTRAIGDIAHKDVIRLLDKAADKTSPVRANRVLAAIRVLFNWALSRQIIHASPVAGIKPPGKEVSRDRVLVGDEIKAVWNAFDKLGWPFGPAFKLLLITGQRRDEVATMRWRDVDLNLALWTLPRESTKADRMNEVPLSPLALEVLGTVKRTSKEYVFSTNGETPISGFSKAKGRAELTIAMDRLQASGKAKPTAKQINKAKLPDWRLHDLRRTVASNMAKLGIAPHVIEKVLNHSTGTISGVAAVYNRYGYADEKRAALGTWARALEAVVCPSDSNVIEIRGR